MAVSGGIDSVASLRLLLELRFELGIVLSVVHFNHKLRGAESDGDEEFVRNLAREHDLEFYVDRGDVAGHAQEEGVSLETAARELRYEFFRSLIRDTPDIPTLSQSTREGWGNPSDVSVPTSRKSGETWGTPGDFSPKRGQTALDKIATGHTLDDQAETVLMRLIRGAGMRGLAAIYPRIEVEDDDGEHCGEIVRPLLETRRCELERYLRDIDQSWREDSTNAEHHFTRNRVRKLLVPLLEKEFNPKIAEGLAELAEIAREEEDYWENEVAGWMGTAVHWTGPEWSGSQNPLDLIQIQPVASSEDSAPGLWMNASVDRLWFLGEPIAVQRRLIKAIAEEALIPLEFNHVEEIIRFAAESGPSGKGLVLPKGWRLRREPARLLFVAPDLRGPTGPAEYEYSLPIPGKIIVKELASEFEAQIVDAADAAAYELDHLLAAESVRGPLTVRNWRPGDRFWPGHSKSTKKVKELLNELHIAHGARASWPVIANGDEIIWVRGFPVCSKNRAKAGQQALLIRETPLLR